LSWCPPFTSGGGSCPEVPILFPLPRGLHEVFFPPLLVPFFSLFLLPLFVFFFERLSLPPFLATRIFYTEPPLLARAPSNPSVSRPPPPLWVFYHKPFVPDNPPSSQADPPLNPCRRLQRRPPHAAHAALFLLIPVAPYSVGLTLDWTWTIIVFLPPM